MPGQAGHDEAEGETMMSVRIALPPAIDPAAFAALDPYAAVAALGGEAMGTTWRVLAVHPPAEAAALVAWRLEKLVAEMSHWASASLLSRFNRAPAGSWHALPADFAHVVAAGMRIARASGGAFDPAIGALVDLHGYGPPGPQPVPDEAAVAAALTVSGHARLSYDPAARRMLQPGGVALDLSGIAKGHAVDAVAALLRHHGVAHGLVEIGGELAGWGVQPSGEPWWVDLETPAGVAAAPLRVALHGLAVATSGDYVRGAHTIDPRTGRPADHGLVAVSVVHADAMSADAWASALLVLGPEEGARLAARERLAARFLSRDGEHLTPALAAMLDDQPSVTA
ncbi:FAD:protein FMN transferase [Sphingomonas corticis]|nr:FAD:protein FMN transferase [Sphingomonas corticis]